MKENIINFYSTKDDYGCFSNFSAQPFRLKDKIWKTSEHYFQAQKFAETEHEEELRLVDSPMVVARMDATVNDRFAKIGKSLKTT